MKLFLIFVLGAASFFPSSWMMFANFFGNTSSVSGTAEEGNPRLKHFRLDKEKVAIDGYDPVSYFRGGPAKGQRSLAYDYDGVIYFFANKDNRDEFSRNPAKYEPVWGGWCGHAMALRGEKVEINPKCYKIIGGRNVLFYKAWDANALTNWEKEIKTTPEAQLMQKGDAFWKNIIAQ